MDIEELDHKLINDACIKVNRPLVFTLIRSTLAGFYIGLGCVFMLAIKTDPMLIKSMNNIFSGVVFSIGLLLVFYLYGELFTGNCVLLYSVLRKKISYYDIFMLLSVNFYFNFIGISIVFILARYIGFVDISKSIATYKFLLPPNMLFIKGIFCNILICISVFLFKKTSNLLEGVITVVFPVTMFVACGFEHSIADMFFGMVAICYSVDTVKVIIMIITIAIGNLVGGFFITWMLYLAINYELPKNIEEDYVENTDTENIKGIDPLKFIDSHYDSNKE